MDSGQVKRSYKQEFLQRQIEDMDSKVQLMMASTCSAGGSQLDAILDLQQQREKLCSELRKLKNTQARQQRFRDKKKQLQNSPLSSSPSPPMSAASSTSSSPSAMPEAILNGFSPSSVIAQLPIMSTPLSTLMLISQSPTAPVLITKTERPTPCALDVVHAWICGPESDFLQLCQLMIPNRWEASISPELLKLIQVRQRYLNDLKEYGHDTAVALAKMVCMVSQDFVREISGVIQLLKGT
eukprot:TRINITY_DN3686_c0_g1_i9.p1 TRINITY_DN3686_c0_g1~~TRINITY_DN3686_c0_g1_i9.p1  ORF type:complete len:240 (-),score=52.69 TRINITY_DN3686_c0_g1_i9:111-830(-)